MFSRVSRRRGAINTAAVQSFFEITRQDYLCLADIDMSPSSGLRIGAKTRLHFQVAGAIV